jgi:hemolysin III
MDIDDIGNRFQDLLLWPLGRRLYRHLLLMGWSMLAGGNSFFLRMPHAVFQMVLAGGIIYSLGVIFYLWDRYFYSHALWHLFVLAAAICHYVAILLSV